MTSRASSRRRPVHPGTILLAILLAICVPLLSGCAGSGKASTSDETEAGEAEENGTGDTELAANKDKADEEKEDAVPVAVTVLDRGPMESVLRFSTNLEAEDKVQVFSQAQAQRRVTELLVEEGDRVDRGALLLRLQDEEQRNALAKVESQLRKAKREFERQKKLYEERLISEKVYLDAEYELEQLAIALAEVRRELGYTTVRAPIAGTVTARRVNLGDTIAMNQHLFDIVDFDSLVARIYVPEKNLAEVQEGQVARLGTQASSRDYRGRIDRIAPVVDPKSGTVKVTVAVGGQPGLRPGLYVDVDLVTATNDAALRVPKRALVYDNDRVFVYRLGDDSRVERIPVTPRLADKNYVEPMDRLAEGDRIVVAGQAGLKNGSLVSLPETRDTDTAESDEDASTSAAATEVARSSS